jgi:crotonobetainyl-CoA:carnitine CoA-transferase CaiB-like acyl-CoA transferase
MDMSRSALEGVMVISLGTGAVVPDAGKIFGELGANVIKIESSEHQDFVRTLSVKKNDVAGFNETNRNKRSFGVDLRTEKGKDLVRRLIKMSDVVAENFRGGVVKSLGFNYESVRKLKPDIIYVSSQGFGRGGPHADYPAYGPMLASASGMLSIWKQPEDPFPAGSNSPLPDFMASKFVVIAILAALDYKRRTGKGQFIDMAQTEVAAALMGEKYLEYTMNKREPQPMGNRCPYAAPHNCYPCQGQDNWVAISVFTNEEWRSFGKALGDPAWTKDPKFADIPGRLKNVDELDKLIVEWTSPRDAWEVMEILQRAGVPAGVVQRAPDTMKDPQIKHLNALIELDHPAVGKRLYPNIPFHMSETPPVPSRPAPLLGQHTEEICRELLKMSAAEIERLKAEKVLESA